MTNPSDSIKAEHARLSERFELRSDLFDQMMRRHRAERDMLHRDLVEAGVAVERFEDEHPEVKP